MVITPFSKTGCYYYIITFCYGESDDVILYTYLSVASKVIFLECGERVLC